MLKRILTIPMVLLIALVYFFHTELFVSGVRLYLTVAKSNPRAEHLLGDYYQHASHQNAALSNIFYIKSLAAYKAKLASVATTDKAKLQYNVGKFYHCGHGTVIDPVEAKRWYDLALQSAQSAKQDTKTIEETLSDLNTKGGEMRACSYITDWKFVLDTLRHE